MAKLPKRLPLPIVLPDGRQTFYPREIMEMLCVSGEQLRALAQEGTLVAINVARQSGRPVFRYTRDCLISFIRDRNTRDNPNQRRVLVDHETTTKARKPRK